MSSQSLKSDLMHPRLPGGLFSPDRYHYYDTLVSSNQEAARLARDGAPEGSLVVADAQSGGKGRLGRVWASPPGLNLYFSMLLRPRMRAEHAAQWTLLTGVAAKATMDRLQIPGVSIKWPNDLLAEGRKLGGILTEMRLRGEKVGAVIIGVGINVNMQLRMRRWNYRIG